MTQPDAIASKAVEAAREAAQEEAGDFGVGDYLGVVAEQGARVVTHYFACPHPGYRGWRWAVTMSRASRARYATVNEVVLVPGDDSLQAPEWVPWAHRIEPKDLTPGAILPTSDNDPRLDPGYVPQELTDDTDPMEWAQTRTVAHELGLGRERILSVTGRDMAAQRWITTRGGPDNATTRTAPGHCVSCGYFVRLSGALGNAFGVCANEYSMSDARVVSVDHGCGGHSDAVAPERTIELPPPVYDTISIDDTGGY